MKQRPSFQYKCHPSFFINAQEFIIWALAKNPKEIGDIFQKICEASMARNEKYLNQYPFICRILKGTQKYPSLPIKTRRLVLAIGKCVKCGTKKRLTVDHIKPQSKGGKHNIRNLQCLCFTCNLKKSDS